MSTGKQLTALLLLTTALTFPAGAAFAQDASTGAEGVPAEQDPATDAVMAQQAEGIAWGRALKKVLCRNRLLPDCCLIAY